MTPSSIRPWVVSLTILVGLSLLATAYALAGKNSNKQAKNGESVIRVAFLGNSILYYNDCPRLLQRMVSDMVQNSCLRGGASLMSLLSKGNGMQEKFASHNALLESGEYDIGVPTVDDLLNDNKWDFVVMNDYTQSPARIDSRQATAEVLKQQYAPLFRKCGAVPVLLQTCAYRVPAIRNTEDLGDANEFTLRLKAGYEYYQNALAKELPPNQQPRVAPVGDAFLYVHQHNDTLWNKLFWTDDFHPSPYGTWLEACVLYCTILDQAPPVYNESWWDTARYFPSEEKTNVPFPTASEAHELREVACIVCGVGEYGQASLEDPQ